MSGSARGRRPAGSDTRAAIEAAARRRFSELGYPRTTMRAIAHDAGVDPRLITHFFGSKQQLFVAVVELPFQPDEVFPALLAAGGDDVGARIADFIVGLLEHEETRSTVTSIIRAAASEEQAAEQVRTLVATRLLEPLASSLGVDQPQLRAAMMASHVVGLAFARHVVGIPALVEADPRRLRWFLGRVFDVYVRGPSGLAADA